MEPEPVEEVFEAEFQYHEMFFVLNLVKLTPVCFIESMTIVSRCARCEVCRVRKCARLRNS